MMVNSREYEPKRPGGIALRPYLWERVEALAEARGESKSRVMEAVLELYLPTMPELPKSHLETLKLVTTGEDDDDD